jgi:putative transposase
LTFISHKINIVFVKTRYTFRFYPTQEQEQSLVKTFGCVRVVYNNALRARIDAWHNGEKVNYNQSSAALTLLKKEAEFMWLNEVSCVPLQQSLRHLQVAFKNFFDKRSKHPTFKSKRSRQSAEYTCSAFKWDSGNRNLTIAKLGRLKVKWSRSFQSNPTTVTISKDCSGRYFVSLVLDEAVDLIPMTGKSIGIDVGINRLATLSNGERIPNPRHTTKFANKLAKEQRRLAKKTKGSGRWNKQRLRVAKVHAKIADSRKDHLNKVTIDLVKRFDLICIEDLNVRGMVKNHRLAKHISDVSFGTFRAMLEYKALWHGKEVVAIDRFFPSSKRCSACGFVASKMPLDVREWTCTNCGACHDRDENAAHNIHAVGQTVKARGENVRLS